MTDDLDELLRRTMKTLDAQVPSGYFEALPNHTLARLEASMQHGSSGVDDEWGAEPSKGTGVPPMPQMPKVPEVPDEDSGLHDIRSLAQSTKQRLSTKRSTTNPPISDEDVLASSSAGWKAVALPQPAKMVTLPELAELPPKQVVIAQDKAAQAARVESAPAVEIRRPFERPAPAKRGKAGTIALVGIGLAAAAGAVIFVATQRDKAEPPPTTTIAAAAPETPRQVPPPAPAAAPAVAEIATAEPAEDKPADLAQPAKPLATSKATKVGHAGRGKAEVAKDASEVRAVEAKPPVDKKSEAKKPGAKGDSDPSFDDLLKEAGVDQKKEAKPKLDKKSLSGDDFKRGMSTVAAKAAACYKGTQGTASVKLTIAPSGRVTKVTVGGQFANGPEAACVSGAVQAASFPAWDGGPQSFNYSYLLSE